MFNPVLTRAASLQDESENICLRMEYRFFKTLSHVLLFNNVIKHVRFHVMRNSTIQSSSITGFIGSVSELSGPIEQTMLYLSQMLLLSVNKYSFRLLI